ncbi:hypothetical protein NQZ68_008994 [Dissostichus eleginoides]|nr:hypothetical protein NQZ68_008994 [Dissostichus eleginoides]
MEQRRCEMRRARGCLLGCVVAVLLWSVASAQIRYSISEEVNEGTAVGNIAKDLGLDKRTLKDRKYRIVSSNADPLFHVNQNDGVLYVSRKIDREEVCTQSGTCLMNLKTVLENPLEVHYVGVEVLDINDHFPSFPDQETTLEISESVIPGVRIQLKASRDPDSGPFSVQHYKLNDNDHFRLEIKDKGADVKAFDHDEKDNALITYHILRDGSEGNKLTSFLNINSETGDILGLKSFDFETLKTFQFQVVATDSGNPSLSSNVTVHVFILDQNDNAPVILYPVSSNGSAEGVEEIPRNVNAGHLVTKVRAYDADIGYNGWLLFSLQEVTAHSLFGLDRYTGQIRTLRSFTETDEAEHKLLILVKDNGNVSLSATATVVVKLVEPREAFAAADVKSASKDDEDNNVTFYLMITLGSVSTLFLISIIVLIAMQCSKSTDYTSKYLQETNYDGTLCHSIQYRSGDKRYMLVGPRMSIGSTIVPGSHANTLVLPDRRGTSTEPCEESLPFLFLIMEQRGCVEGMARRRWIGCVVAVLLWSVTSAQLRYSISEEVNEGTVVGNIAKDLGLDKSTLKDRKYRIVSSNADPLFHVNQNDGVLYVSRKIDREGVCERSSTCLINLKTVLENPLEVHYVGVEVMDINDHSPSFPDEEKTLEISESVLPGARFPLQAARDPDGGPFTVQQYKLSHNGHFRLEVKDHVTKSPLDREKQSQYVLTVTAKDGGQPPLSSEKTINVVVSDVNDNSPEFSLSPYTFYITEANEPGTSVFSVKAFDRDENDNALITYHILRDGSKGNKLTSYLNINSETGDILALKSFDFETLKTFKFQVVATDSGTPSLSSNVTVHVFILDQNDNTPVILYPVSSNGSAEGVEEIPRNVNAGHLVTKVRAYDADIGYNGWLLFSLQEVTAHSLFGLDRYTGQIRTLRSFTETDEAEHKLLILVKDNGNVSLSATATVVVKLVEPREAFAAADVKSASKDDEDNNVTFYLMITLGSVSTLFLISIIVLIAMQCSKSTDYTSKYLQETNYDGTLCHSIQYRSGDKRYMLVGPRMSIGSTIVPGSHANTLVLPDRRGTSTEGLTMEQRRCEMRRAREWFLRCVVAVLLWSVVSAQIRYSISEEVNEGTVVGNIAKDLGLDKSTLKDRKYRIVSSNADPLFHVNQNDGVLYVSRKIDREEVCAQSSTCLMNLKTVLENPLEVHYVGVEVLDINDHSPSFPEEVKQLDISESVLPGARFQLKASRDPDSGPFSVQQYKLSQNDYFRLEVRDKGEDGEITVKGLIDYEQRDKYEIEIQASDKGLAPLTTEKSVIIQIVDVNDNAPEIEVTSFSNSIPEDSRPGTTVALISVNDLDSGLNGKVICSIVEDVPFVLTLSLQDKMFSLVTKTPLDREKQSQYVLTITAKDGGQPPLSSEKTINVVVSDVNDNSPEFSLSPYTFYITEANEPGTAVFSVKALDRDENDNALITYHILRDGSEGNKLTSFLNINSETGDILALKSFDFETLKTFQFQVVATDSGTPSLSSNVTVHVFILDQNDNAPVILYPVSSNGSAEGVEEIPRNVNAGHLVTKVRAYDADIGYNGWLLFSLQEVTAHSLFGLDRYTGQIRTLRSFTETDEAEHKLLILVKDNGNVSLSATATVVVKLVEPREAFAAADVKSASKDDEDNNVTFYLMITLGSVSTLFLISIIVLIAMQCSKSTDYTSKYLQETNYDGTLCHSIQYRSGDKRYMLVGPRMSIGSTIVPGSHSNTLVLPDRRGTSTERAAAVDSAMEMLRLHGSFPNGLERSLSSDQLFHL